MPVSTTNDPFLNDAVSEMERLKKTLKEEFNSYFSLKIDLRTYEDCIVTLPNGEV